MNEFNKKFETPFTNFTWAAFIIYGIVLGACGEKERSAAAFIIISVAWVSIKILLDAIDSVYSIVKEKLFKNDEDVNDDT